MCVLGYTYQKEEVIGILSFLLNEFSDTVYRVNKFDRERTGKCYVIIYCIYIYTYINI